MTASASADTVAAARRCGRGSSRWSRPWSWRQSLRLFENTAQVGRQLVGIERRRQVAGDARLRVDHYPRRGMVQGVVAGGFDRHLRVRNAQPPIQFMQFVFLCGTLDAVRVAYDHISLALFLRSYVYL